MRIGTGVISLTLVKKFGILERINYVVIRICWLEDSVCVCGQCHKCRSKVFGRNLCVCVCVCVCVCMCAGLYVCVYVCLSICLSVCPISWPKK